jgi:uncharacterized protein (DUF362 family)
MMSSHVVLVRGDARYPARAVEWRSAPMGAMLRQLFAAWGLDPENPFREHVRPGQTALIKPNWVNHRNPLGFDLDSLVTHPSLVAAMIDLLAIAMEGRGRIVIGDAPIQSTNFRSLCEQMGIDEIVAAAKARHPDLEVLVEDWRLTVMEHGTGDGGKGSQRTLDAFGAEASRTHRLVDLGTTSFLDEISDYASRFRVTNYRPSLMREHHHYGVHRYLVTTRIDADFTINLPKMKTHMKAGLTGAMKNSVGINGHKEYLPHHITGPYFQGGDNYPSSNRWWSLYERLYDEHWEEYHQRSSLRRRIGANLVRFAWAMSQAPRRVRVSAGSWSGNDTVWRTTMDLATTWFFDGERQRNVITIVDGIVAGQGLGQLSPTTKPAGMLIGGENPACIDAVIAQVIGYNLARIPTVYNALYNRKSRFSIESLDQLRVLQVDASGTRELGLEDIASLDFVLPAHWGYAARGPDARPAATAREAYKPGSAAEVPVR